ncbi:hypothetical protein KPL70_005096 [Citrus sinensis]|uniref:Uncharacterized protein n=1 Tax=Citrus sinensis TaxID=2711 RepID=A0ACB8NGH2_CITSI|nr:hypothetical protein KPL70_005096 [Citrus sinensis]KAH9796946.1 hypothetical protein KPL71_005693 [Citrus sinensis]
MNQMIPQQWASPCGNQCTQKFAALTQIPCLAECNEICYKDPVLKDRQWSAYIDRSPGAANYSEFEIDTEKVDKVRPNRPPPPPPVAKPPPHVVRPGELTQDLPGTSA